MGRSKAVTKLMTMNRDLFPEYRINDRIVIGGWEFDVEMMVRKRWGLASAIQGGRVISLELYQSGEPVAIFEDGKWIMPANEENDPANIALTYFLCKHNKKRPRDIERKMWIHEY